MSQDEVMLRWWTITLIAILNGLTLASTQMLGVGEEKRIVEVLMESMQDMTGGYTPEQKQLLVAQLALLSGLTVRVEPPS